MHKSTKTEPPVNRAMISLRTLAWQFDANRSAVRRWLRDAGIKPVVVGRGRNASIRYDIKDVEAWMQGRGSGD